MNVIPWWDWLLSSTPDLKRRGFDPAQRVLHTGHRRPMSPAWANTIGMWCRSNAADIMHRIWPGEMNAETKDLIRARYDVFRYRHRLKLRREFCADVKLDYDSFMAVGPVVVATFAHLRMKDHLDRSPELSPAAVAHNAALYDVDEMKNPPSTRESEPFGLLPIEMLLYYHAVEHIFEEEPTIDFFQWHEGGGDEERWEDRARYWKKHECNALVRLPSAALERYPLDHA